MSRTETRALKPQRRGGIDWSRFATPALGFGKRLMGSAWLFPVILTAFLLTLTVLKVNGSSIGIYHTLFYGAAKDPSLVVNHPESIRSDEWVVNTQMTIAQKTGKFSTVNKNIGNGENMSLVLDAPYKEWSEIFKPHNWAFFVLPFDMAFAFKWWFLAYLLLLSCYLFCLALMPGRRLIAALLSIALLFSAFIQWWYQYSTLASIYYALFCMTVFIHLMRAQRFRTAAKWAFLLSYLIVSFAMVLYPPFQIPCALIAVAFGLGYLLQQYYGDRAIWFYKKLLLLLLSVLIAGSVVGVFLITRGSVVHAFENTAYPGKRVTASGGFDVAHTFSGHLAYQFQNPVTAAVYQIPSNGLTNQSESSNFILLLPFLVLPSLYIMFLDFKKGRRLDWSLLAMNAVFLLFISWLFIPHLAILGKLSLLSRVPQTRLLIGLGLLNVVQLILVIRRLQESKTRLAPHIFLILYAVLVFTVEILLGLHAMHRFHGFIGWHKVLAFSLPVPVIIYLLLRKYFVLAMLGFLAFSVFTTYLIHPLYRGTQVVTATPLSRAIRDVASHDSGRWAIEPVYLENFATINGARSLSGVYVYPQLELWKAFGKNNQYIYNRYAHVTFNFDREASLEVPTTIELPGPDHFSITTEPCSTFLKNDDVHFLLTEAPLDQSESCTTLIRTVSYPHHSYFIYKLN